MDIRILIIDDDELVAMSLGMILNAEDDLKVVGKGYGGADAVRLYDELHPDVLLMDIRMKDMTGLDAAQLILSDHADARILLLTTFSDDEYIVKALQIGVKGYLLKQDYRSVASSIRAVYHGQNVFGGAIVKKLPGLMQPDRNQNGQRAQDGGDAPAAGDTAEDEKVQKAYLSKGITEREYQLIQLVGRGLSNREIAEKVFLSEGTVKNYLSSILDKLGLRDRTQLAVYYFENR